MTYFEASLNYKRKEGEMIRLSRPRRCRSRRMKRLVKFFREFIKEPDYLLAS